MKNDLIHLGSQRKLVKDSSVDVADNANMWAHGIPASYLGAVWSSIIPPCCQMVQFHLTVELPFPDFQDFFRLDVSSPQFLSTLYGWVLSCFSRRSRWSCLVIGDFASVSSGCCCFFLSITRYVPVPQPSPPVYHAVPVPVPMKSPGKVVKVPVPLPAKTLVKHKVFWAGRLGRLGKVGGWGGDFGLIKVGWRRRDFFLSLSRVMNWAASNFFTGESFFNINETNPQYCFNWFFPYHDSYSLPPKIAPQLCFTCLESSDSFERILSSSRPRKLPDTGMEQGHVFSEDAYFWTWKSIITIYRVISHMSPYASKGGVMFLPGKLAWQNKMSSNLRSNVRSQRNRIHFLIITF